MKKIILFLRLVFLTDLLKGKIINSLLLGVIIFGSVRFLSKKVIKPKFFFEKKPKPNRNWVKLAGFGSVRFGFLGQKPVQTGLARFFWFWLGFFRFGSVFPVWLGFFLVFCRFRFGSVRFFGYKTETELNRPVFSKKKKIRFGFFGFFFRFSRFNWFSGFFAHP
jgi:hypothetical protein